MAFNEDTVQRIRQKLVNKGVSFTEIKMFSGVCFMVDDKMFCGTHIDKKSGKQVLLCRIGEEAYESALDKDSCIPMDITGKPMKGFVYVTENGFRNNKELDNWLQLCLNFNPLAKKSKKK